MSAPQNSPILKTQPQNAQLELIFRGPLVKGSQVESLTELVALDIRYNYKHRTVWVKDLESNYFLIDGDGTQLSHWKKHTNRLIIELYNPLNVYQQGDTVYLSNKIYNAKQNVPVGTNPLDNLDYWQIISGESITQRFVFKQQSNVIIYTEIRNPIFQIVLGTLETDVNDDYVIGDDGMINIINPEIIQANIKRRTDLVNNNGKAYEISFEEDSLPVLLEGAINVK